MATASSEGRRTVVLAALLSLAAFGGCGATWHRGATPGVEEGLRFTENGLHARVQHRLAALSEAYHRGDLPVFLAQVDRRYRLDRRLLGRMLPDEWETRRDCQLSFRVDRIEGLRQRVEARVRWEKSYVILVTGQRVVERGRCVLVFVRNRFLPLFDVRGDLPFGAG